MRVFEGCCTALVTPFGYDGNPDYEALEKLIEFNIENKADALLSCGTTGEAAVLSDEEHKKVMRVTVKKAGGRLPVICSTGSNDTRHAQHLSSEAERMGADALLLVTPYYNKCSKEGLYRHFKAIAERVGIPCIIYNVPGRTGVSIDREDFERLCNIKNICGIKEASGNIEIAGDMISTGGESVSVYSGNDDLTIPIIKRGGRGVISVLSNIAPLEVSKMTELSLRGKFKEAEEIHENFKELERLLFKEVNPIPVKYCLYLMGFIKDCYRLPLCEPDDSLKAELRQELLKRGLIND